MDAFPKFVAFVAQMQAVSHAGAVTVHPAVKSRRHAALLAEFLGFRFGGGRFDAGLGGASFGWLVRVLFDAWFGLVAVLAFALTFRLVIGECACACGGDPRFFAFRAASLFLFALFDVGLTAGLRFLGGFAFVAAGTELRFGEWPASAATVLTRSAAGA